jgi:hypothetical protein
MLGRFTWAIFGIFGVILFLVGSGFARDVGEKPPPFPLSYYSILTVMDNRTEYVYYSGRWWYDYITQKQRLDLKQQNYLLTTIWRFDGNFMYLINQTNQGYDCQRASLGGRKMEPPLNLTNTIDRGSAVRWDEKCDWYQLYNATDRKYANYYVLTNSKLPFELIRTDEISVGWIFMQPGFPKDSDFEPPNGVNCRQVSGYEDWNSPIDVILDSMNYVKKGNGAKPVFVKN